MAGNAMTWVGSALAVPPTPEQAAGCGLSGADGGFWRDRGGGGELGEVGGGAPVDFGDRVGVVPERGRPAAAVAEPRGGVAQVEAGGEELAGGVVPEPLDVELHPGGRSGISHPV